jgi:hypothetical protein
MDTSMFDGQERLRGAAGTIIIINIRKLVKSNSFTQTITNDPHDNGDEDPHGPGSERGGISIY